jgi:anti-sigma factor RsiW
MKAECAACTSLWDDYLDGELASRERAVLEAHLRACDECRAALGELSLAEEALTQLPVQRCPDRVLDAVMDDAGAGEARRRFPWGRLAAGLGAVAATLLIVVLPMRRGSSPSDEELLRARKQARWSLTYVVQTMNRSRDQAIERVLEKQLHQTIKGRISRALAGIEGGQE